MQVCMLISGQEDVTWQQWLALVGAAEESGVEGIFSSDHYLSDIREDRGSLDAWAILAALAGSTNRVRLGTLVSPATFHHPSKLAKMVATVDHISGGRVELGLGAGWNEREHLAYGFPFPQKRVRMELVEEALEIVLRSWSEDSFSFEGRHYQLKDCPALPKPLQQPHPPLIVGSSGSRRSLDLAARFADEYNALLPSVEECRERRGRLVEACETMGRDPASIRLSVMTGCVIGADRGELLQRAQLALRRSGLENEDPAALLAQRRDIWVTGTVDEAIQRIREFEEIGVERVYLQHVAQPDVEMVRLIGAAIVPAVSRHAPGTLDEASVR